MSELVEASARKSEAPTVIDAINSMSGEIEKQLAGAMSSDAFVRAVISEVRKNGLEQADAGSLLGSVMLAAQLRLEIGSALGQFYLTPRRVNGVLTCVPIIGYKGYIELARRSGHFEKIEAFLVREGDEFDYWADSESGMRYAWRPADLEETRPWTGVIASAKVRDGGTQWIYVPRSNVLSRRPSRWEKTPWKTSEEAMVRKTGVRALASMLPLSVEFARAVEADEQEVKRIPGAAELEVLRLPEETE